MPIFSQNITPPDLFLEEETVFNAKDLYRFSQLWNMHTVPGEAGDFNSDGKIDCNDLLLLLSQFKKIDPSPTQTAGLETLTPTGTSNEPATQTPTGTPSIPTPTITLMATLSGDETFTPTATATISATHSPLHTPTPTPTGTWIPDETTTPTVTSTSTAQPQEATPTIGDNPTPGDAVTPTFTPQVGNPSPTPTGWESSLTPTQPPFIRSWHVNRSLNLFPNESVLLPRTSQIAASNLGYSVATTTKSGSPRFVSFDRIGRVFQRRLPISIDEYSGLTLVDGLMNFGKFFENPSDTRRYRFEAFNLNEPEGETITIDHLSADAIAWSFTGSDTGCGMAILRYPNILTLHSINSQGQILSSKSIETPLPMPTNPAYVGLIISGESIGVLYSSNYSESKRSAGPLSLWIFNQQGELLTKNPITFLEDITGECFAGDGQGNFFLILGSNYGPRLFLVNTSGIIQVRVLGVDSIDGMQWLDNLLWILDGQNSEIIGYTQDGYKHTGPVKIFPSGWTRGIQWLDLRKSGEDLGAFFTDSGTRDAVYYLQLESGPLLTPTPLPSSGIPTGATSSIPLGENLAIELVRIPAGSYTRGSPENEIGRQSHEGPQHLVTLTQDFYMSRYEITNAQYRALNPNHPPLRYGGQTYEGDDLPASGVTWEQANEFCAWLSNVTGYEVSLPTEAEWEYACRAGTNTRRYWGEDKDDELIASHANVPDVQSATAFNFINVVHGDDGYPGPAPAGSFPPNDFGLYDMQGNVWEWCSDWFSARTYTAETQVDPIGPLSGFSRVIRGGSWEGATQGTQQASSIIRSAYRNGFTPSETRPAFGFRIVMRGGE